MNTNFLTYDQPDSVARKLTSTADVSSCDLKCAIINALVRIDALERLAHWVGRTPSDQTQPVDTGLQLAMRRADAMRCACDYLRMNAPGKALEVLESNL